MSVRPITDTLRLLDGGAFLDLASVELNNLVRQVDETGKGGSLTIKLDLKRARAGAINIMPSVTAKVPQTKPDPTLLWATVEGNLTFDNPSQQKLDLRTVDKTTGEIRVIEPGGVQRWGSGVHDIGKPVPTVTTKAEHMLAVPTLVQTGYGERPGQAPRVPGIDKPLGTVVGGQKHAVVAAFLAKHYGGVTGHGVEQPIGTVTTTDHHSLVAAAIAPLRGTSPSHRSAHSVEAPLSTVSAGGQHHGLVAAFLTAYYGSDQDTPLDDPLHTITTKPRFALVMVDGVPHEIADIGMRMLQPRELYTAQGFPASYVIDRGADGRPLSKAAQVRMCGNSVAPPVAAAIVRANYADTADLRRAA